MADNIFQKIYRGAQELFSKDNDNFQGHTVVPKKDLSNLSRILTGAENESELQSKWTQVVYKNKYSFQNPLKQTFRQKKVLSKYLDLEESHIETVVCFVGDSKFKTELPSNVLSSGLGRYIKQFQI